jgi:hypothetical protein
VIGTFRRFRRFLEVPERGHTNCQFDELCVGEMTLYEGLSEDSFAPVLRLSY